MQKTIIYLEEEKELLSIIEALEFKSENSLGLKPFEWLLLFRLRDLYYDEAEAEKT